jgi:hypothetical protein
MARSVQPDRGVSIHDQPRPVASYVMCLCRLPEGERADYGALWDRLLTMRGDTGAGSKAVGREMGLDERVASFHCRQMREGVEYPTGPEMVQMAETRLQGAREAAQRRAHEPRRPDPYHPGAPTLPGHRSPSA